MRKRVAGRSRGLVLQWRECRFYMDTVLLLAALGLLLLGYVMVASASLHLGDRLAEDSFYFPRHQFLHIALGLVAGCLTASVKLETWRRSAVPLYFLGDQDQDQQK